MNCFRTFFKHHRVSFSKATATALLASVVDFSTLYCLVEFAHIYYVTATACAAFCGAVTNFAANKTWAFQDASPSKTHIQGFRYALVSAGSMALNTFLVFLFTDFGHLRYLVSKLIAAISVGWLWNYPLHRFFVFPKVSK